MWIKDPSQSVVLEVHADLRTIPSSTFATKLSLRFPAVHDIRWHVCEGWRVVEEYIGGGKGSRSPGAC